MHARLISIICAAASTIIFAACAQNATSWLGGGCTSDQDCGPLETCDLATGSCTALGKQGECKSSLDCPAGYKCLADDRRCVVDEQSQDCGTGKECPENYECLAISGGKSKCVPMSEFTGCKSGADCPEGYSCNLETSKCDPDPDAVGCSDKACPEGYTCLQGPGGFKKCIPNTDQTGDGDAETEGDTQVFGCDPPCSPDQICCDNECLTKYPSCVAGQNCFTGQTCDPAQARCQGEPTSCEKMTIEADYDYVPTDEDPDVEIPPVDGDTGTDGDIDIPPTGCTTDGQCPAGSHCGEGGRCVENCNTAGCTYGVCNTGNGRCEFCTSTCASNQCCNFNMTFWYCGRCCEPPCPGGQACQAGRCVPLQCASDCDLNCNDCSIQNGFICERKANADQIPGCRDGGDQDQDGETGSCLQANASCQNGGTPCCSGVCLMGTCL